MKEIVLANGRGVALVDDTDYEWLNQWSWNAKPGKSGIVYAGRWPNILMHRLIMGNPHGLLVDHWDRNGLNNQRSNLRLATHRENAANSRMPLIPGKTSQYKGVSWHKQQKWVAEIHRNGKKYSLGYFDIEIDAARAYDAAARQLHGEYARLNFPNEQEQAA